jgi:hypothetical protein
MTTQRIEHEPTRSRGRTPALWPLIAVFPFITTGVLIAGVLTAPPALRSGRPETGLITRCPAGLDGARLTMPQRFPGHSPGASFAGASPLRLPVAGRFDKCDAAPDHQSPSSDP